MNIEAIKEVVQAMNKCFQFSNNSCTTKLPNNKDVLALKLYCIRRLL